MRTKYLFLSSLLLLAIVLLAACSANNPSPLSNANNGSIRSETPSNSTGSSTLNGMGSNLSGAQSPSGLAAQTVEGGNVSVTVKPLTWKFDQPLAFDIAMNTHSVELANDMLKAVILRDDSGMEYVPTAWDGPTGGGHHREGTVKFAPLSMPTKTLTLVVKNIAGVQARVFAWELAQ